MDHNNPARPISDKYGFTKREEIALRILEKLIEIKGPLTFRPSDRNEICSTAWVLAHEFIKKDPANGN